MAITTSTPEQRIDLVWPQVHALVLLAQSTSYTRVAQRLGLSKAAVSQRISDLERAVGQTLVQRTTRSVRLTDAGQRLVEQTAESFALITRSVGEARDLAAKPRGLVRLTAPVALGRQHLAPQLEAFLREQPDVRVELDLSDRLATLAHEGYDLAVRHTSAPPDTHVAWKLCASRSLLVASAAYLKRRGTPDHPNELAHHACLAYLRPGRTVWQMERIAKERGSRSGPERLNVTVQGPLRASNSEVLRDAALSGLGIALVPDFSVVDALRARRLRVVLPAWRPVGAFGDAIYAMHPWSPTTPKAVQALVAHLRQALSGGFPID
ncbi:MAG: LysR family transcriptional regulator [Rhizobacter sp.]